MIRNRTARFVKPMLEDLEVRDNPSFVFSGAISGLEQPIAKIVADMTAAGNDLVTQFKAITNGPTLNNTQLAQREGFYGKAVADYQRIFNDHNTVTAMVNADTTFIKAAAMAELTEGDPIDFILLNFGSLFGIRPLDPLTNDMTQSDQFWNGGQLTGDLTTDINTNFNTPTLFLFTTQTIKQGATAPTFG